MNGRIKQLIAEHEDFQRLAKEFPLDFVVDCLANSEKPDINCFGRVLKSNPADSSLFLSGLAYYSLCVFEGCKIGWTYGMIEEYLAPLLDGMSDPDKRKFVGCYMKFYMHIVNDYEKKNNDELIKEVVASNPLRDIVCPRAKQKELEFYQYISRELTETEQPLISWAVASVAPLRDYKDLAFIHRNYINLCCRLREGGYTYTTPFKVRDVIEAIKIFRLGGNECSGARKAMLYAARLNIERFLLS